MHFLQASSELGHFAPAPAMSAVEIFILSRLGAEIQVLWVWPPPSWISGFRICQTALTTAPVGSDCSQIGVGVGVAVGFLTQCAIQVKIQQLPCSICKNICVSSFAATILDSWMSLGFTKLHYFVTLPFSGNFFEAFSLTPKWFRNDGENISLGPFTSQLPGRGLSCNRQLLIRMRSVDI
jgi:hypothetical protein